MAETVPTQTIIDEKVESLEDLTAAKSAESAAGFPDGGARAWSVAAGCGGILFCTFGYINAFGVYQEYYETHFLSNHSPSAISWIGSMQVFFLFSGGLFGGPLFDRFGTKVIWPSVILYILSVMMISLCTQFYQVILAQGILGGITSGMSMAPAMAAIGQYFNKKRGAAMGIAVAASSLGGVIFPIALNNMLDNPKLGFGWTVRICGFIMVAILIPSSLAIRARLPPRKEKFFLPAAFGEAHFVILCAGIFLATLGIFTPLFYLPTYAVEQGMSTNLALYLTAIVNAASFFGRVIPGILADKFGRLNMLCGAAFCTGLLCFCWQRVFSNAALFVFAVFYGFCSGAIVSLMSVSLAQVPKNPGNIGTYMGMGMFTISFAALAGPPVNGALVTHFKSFDQAADFSGAVIIAGGSTVLLAKWKTEKGIFAKN